MSRLGRGFPNNALMWNQPRVNTPVTYDATGAGIHGTGTLTWTHTIAGNAVVVPASIWASASSGDTPAIKVGTTTIPLLGAIGNFYFSGQYMSIYLFGLLNPPTGSQTFTLTPAGGTNDQTAVDSVSYNNVTSFGTPVTNTATGTSATLTVPSATGQMVVNAFTCANVGSGTFTSYNKTSRYSQAGTIGNGQPTIIGDAAGASSVTFTATAPGGSAWGGIGVSLV